MIRYIKEDRPSRSRTQATGKTPEKPVQNTGTGTLPLQLGIQLAKQPNTPPPPQLLLWWVLVVVLWWCWWSVWDIRL